MYCGMGDRRIIIIVVVVSKQKLTNTLSPLSDEGDENAKWFFDYHGCCFVCWLTHWLQSEPNREKKKVREEKKTLLIKLNKRSTSMARKVYKIRKKKIFRRRRAQSICWYSMSSHIFGAVKKNTRNFPHFHPALDLFSMLCDIYWRSSFLLHLFFFIRFDSVLLFSCFFCPFLVAFFPLRFFFCVHSFFSSFQRIKRLECFSFPFFSFFFVLRLLPR